MSSHISEFNDGKAPSWQTLHRPWGSIPHPPGKPLAVTLVEVLVDSVNCSFEAISDYNRLRVTFCCSFTFYLLYNEQKTKRVKY